MNIKYKYIIAIIFSIALFLDRLDLTITNITFPTIARVFNVPLTSTDWVSLCFLLALAIFIFAILGIGLVQKVNIKK